jgi:hypothetical protein
MSFQHPGNAWQKKYRNVCQVFCNFSLSEFQVVGKKILPRPVKESFYCANNGLFDAYLVTYLFKEFIALGWLRHFANLFL